MVLRVTFNARTSPMWERVPIVRDLQARGATVGRREAACDFERRRLTFDVLDLRAPVLDSAALRSLIAGMISGLAIGAAVQSWRIQHRDRPAIAEHAPTFASTTVPPAPSATAASEPTPAVGEGSDPPAESLDEAEAASQATEETGGTGQTAETNEAPERTESRPFASRSRRRDARTSRRAAAAPPRPSPPEGTAPKAYLARQIAELRALDREQGTLFMVELNETDPQDEAALRRLDQMVRAALRQLKGTTRDPE
ncbi:MAG: hypothetical protein IT384_25110 [Deltaproteobacteria bacterium]|nr:hypothetical protein [Deltaproteobacteria bacterium]